MDGDKVVKYVDKILFKEYAESKGVDTAQILLGPFDDADDIKLSDIPNNCVLKLNHGSKLNIAVREGEILFGAQRKKLSSIWPRIKKKLNLWRKPYRPKAAPTPAMSLRLYKCVKPKIFIEELTYPIPVCYHFWVFNGKTKLIEAYCHTGLLHHAEQAQAAQSVGADSAEWLVHGKFYDTNWVDTKCLDKTTIDLNPNSFKYNFPKPDNLNEMIKVAEKLSDDLKFARVDLYNYKNKIMAREITLGIGEGWENFYPIFEGVECKKSSRCEKMLMNFWG